MARTDAALLCDICGAPALGVYASRYGPASFAMYGACLDAGKDALQEWHEERSYFARVVYPESEAVWYAEPLDPPESSTSAYPRCRLCGERFERSGDECYCEGCATLFVMEDFP